MKAVTEHRHLWREAPGSLRKWCDYKVPELTIGNQHGDQPTGEIITLLQKGPEPHHGAAPVTPRIEGTEGSVILWSVCHHASGVRMHTERIHS